jgi:sugar lactone lactonase YvrE
MAVSRCFLSATLAVLLLLQAENSCTAGVFPTDAEVARIARGFSFAEGPAADQAGNIFFTDVPKNRIYKWSEKSGLQLYRKNSGGANGLFVDQTGSLVVCEGANRRIVSIDGQGKTKVLLDSYNGKKLNSPNDIWVDPNGGIYFSDPRYGSKNTVEQDGYHVYYIPRGAQTATRVTDNLIMPNGLTGTPDGKRLFVADWGAAAVYSYVINNDGTLSQQAVFARQQCDGMTVDADGNLYLTAAEQDGKYAVTVFNRDAERIDAIRVPEKPSNVIFGGSDFQTLYITAETSLYAVSLQSHESNKPIGRGRGIFPGRVIWVHDPKSVDSDCVEVPFHAQQQQLYQGVITDMVSSGITLLTGCFDSAEAWQELFRYAKRQSGRPDEGYCRGEKIAIKANFVQTMSNAETPTGHANASPYIILALLRHLVYIADVEQQDITIFDTTAHISDEVLLYCRSEFPGVHFVDKSGGNGWTAFIPDIRCPLFFACLPDKRYYLPACVSEADYIINLATLKTHQYAGVTLCAKNHFGSFGVRPFDLHPHIRVSHTPHNACNPLVELMGHEHLGGKTMLFMIDGLYGGVGWEGLQQKWSMDPFNGNWPASIFFSQDGVAIDSVGLDFLAAEYSIPQNADSYLHEAACAGNPPSGTFYDPEHNNIGLDSLGVHEHWNNPFDKAYSRNLGLQEGIELITW